jgi:lipopolysaccharide/colanic/teichoic acid biosynthesis glycosyltransferase
MNNPFKIESLEYETVLSVTKRTSSIQKIEKEIVKKRSSAVLEFLKECLGDNYLNTYFLASSDNFDILKLERSNYSGIVNLELVNRKRRINKFFEACNYKLEAGGLYIGSVQTYAMRRKALMDKYPFPFNGMVYLIDAVFHRILPKLRITQKLYFYLTKGKNRMISRAETFGRLYSCGFEIVDEKEIDNELFFVARKVNKPAFDLQPTYGPLIRLRRVGKDGKVFRVYKLRTMYPYAEYLQDYVYKHNQLDEGGKFKDDFRVSPMGRFFRKFWIDELPMFWNLLKGDMKLIGVRPLSSHYFSLYTKELQEKRTKTKPGLVPPFYADMPKTLEDIMASELKYLAAYEKAPLRTDIKYFFLIFKNIFFKGARSK